MRILLLAPHPVYQERGTPIAVGLLLRALSERGESVDVLTYHEGRPLHYPGVSVQRIPALPWVRNIRPGFSVKKVFCDLCLAVLAVRQCARRRYDVVHCVEEAALIGRLLRALFGVPYIYDMDSVLSQQLALRGGWWRRWSRLGRVTERWLIRGAAVVVAVCDALAETARQYGARRVVVLRDVSLLDPADASRGVNGSRSDGAADGPVVLYAGNLEPYQGIDLLLESFAMARQAVGQGRLVIVGGNEADRLAYGRRAQALAVGAHVEFLGPRPLAELGRHLAQADILVSPRVAGGNTPMKIYSYLDSGRPILATDLPTHTQVLSREVSVLAAPQAALFAAAMARLMRDDVLRSRLGQAGWRLAQAHYCYPAFRQTVETLYGTLVPQALNGRR